MFGLWAFLHKKEITQPNTLLCGKYGICSDEQCSCPGASSNEAKSFRPVDDRLPNLGCSEITSISCSSSQCYSLMELDNYRYSIFREDTVYRYGELQTGLLGELFMQRR